MERYFTTYGPIEHFNTSSDKDSTCDPRLIGEPNLKTPKSSKEVKQISNPLTPVTPKNADMMTPKPSTSKQVTPVTPTFGTMIIGQIDQEDFHEDFVVMYGKTVIGKRFDIGFLQLPPRPEGYSGDGAVC